ncbi:hypothetical protein EA472_21035 [Natrarchaeobius oligotrophus]|uniref:Uncharacterized protein n=1 Tax=Natrarchaeobius chitinivorans TaxID=1679083 RepID=A0A3N6LY53_NATCH|nr:hypothetical protein EA472_21035 [Natrarchaeobius chitinivorans]
MAGLVALVFAGLWAFEGYYVVTAWFPPLYDEVTPINGVAAGTFMTVMLGCSILTLLRPRTAIGPARTLLIGASLLGLLMPLAFVMTDPLVTGVGILLTAAILSMVVWLHPARDGVLPSRNPDLEWPLLALTILLAVPFLWLAARYQWQQLTLDDKVAGRWFYGGLSMYLLATVSLAAASSVDGTTRRVTGGSAAVLAGILGLVSVVYPGELHSLGLVGGLLVVAWAVCVIAFVTRTNRRRESQ